MVKCTIKWSNQKFDDVEVDSAESAVTFKTQLWTLTGVPVERQKLMAKGAWKGEGARARDARGCAPRGCAHGLGHVASRARARARSRQAC